MYFDNVGGEISDAVLRLINHGARISICGQISMYNLEKPDEGYAPATAFADQQRKDARLYRSAISALNFAEGREQLTQWFSEGKLKYAENIVEGFENTPDAFLGLFEGDNTGKQLVKVGDVE